MTSSKNDIVDRLTKIPLFKGFADRQDVLDRIVGVLEPRSVRKGEQIIVEGASGDEMYILLHGEIEISKFTMEKEQFTVAKLKDAMNIFFGELALVDDDKRSASVTALTDCELLVLTRARFLELGKANTDIGWMMMREIAGILSKRLRKANEDAIVLFETLVNELAS